MAKKPAKTSKTAKKKKPSAKTAAKASKSKPAPGKTSRPKAAKPVLRMPPPLHEMPSVLPTPASSGLTRDDLDMFREALLRKRAEISGNVESLRNETANTSQEAAGNLSAVPQHMADIGSDNYEQEFALVLVEGERALLNEIDDALKRLDKGTFGVCVATGRPIGKARLKATPWTKYCYEYVLAMETGRGPR